MASAERCRHPPQGAADAGRLTPIARAALIALVALAIRAAFVLQFSGQPLFDANQVQGTDMEASPPGRAHRRGNVLSHGTGRIGGPLCSPYAGAVFWLLGPTALVGAALAQAAWAPQRRARVPAGATPV